jgi:hypothetical protein
VADARVSIYLAARSEDQFLAQLLASALKIYGVDVNARWLRSPLTRVTHDEAVICLDDIAAADVFVLLNPKAAHRSGTGGRHVESGVALALGKPMVLVGDYENIFHAHRSWMCASPSDPYQLSLLIRAARSAGRAHESWQRRAS